MVVLKQSGAGPELVHCHDILTLESSMSLTVTPVGVGGAGMVQHYKYSKLHERLHNMYIPLAGRETIVGALVLLI